MGWLLAIPALIVLIQFDLFAGNKPGEYARFALFADTALLMAAFIGIGCDFPVGPAAGGGRNRGRGVHDFAFGGV